MKRETYSILLSFTQVILFTFWTGSVHAEPADPWDQWLCLSGVQPQSTEQHNPIDLNPDHHAALPTT